MKTIVAIFLTLLVAPVASAVIDTGENSVGVYFDENADVYCMEGVTESDMVTMYLVLTNPTFDILNGWECGIDLVGEALVLSLSFYGGYDPGPGPVPIDNLIVGLWTPYPTSIATPLVAINLIYMGTDNGPIDFFVHGTTPSSMNPDYPTLLTSDGELVMGGISVVEGPAAQINGGCQVVATENISFDSIKSLYRN